jgi:prepilin-type N-terminal cleavage/methylation domain-containing protein
MKLNKSKKGFTLLEILIVLVILGVIAGLAIPAYTASVEKSRSQEALQALGAIRDSMVRYYALNNKYDGACFPVGSVSTPLCSGTDGLDGDPSLKTGGQTLHFTYNITSAAGDAFLVTAKRNAADGGDGSSTITINNAGVITKTGAYGG